MKMTWKWHENDEEERKRWKKEMLHIYRCTPGSKWSAAIFWFSPRRDPSCWGRGWWTCPWTICCCKSSRTASDFLAFDSAIHLKWSPFAHCVINVNSINDNLISSFILFFFLMKSNQVNLISFKWRTSIMQKLLIWPVSSSSYCTLAAVIVNYYQVISSKIQIAIINCWFWRLRRQPTGP